MMNPTSSPIPDQYISICAIALDIADGDVERNIDQAEQIICSLKGQKFDLIILPELFTSGFKADSDWLTTIARHNTDLRIQERISSWSHLSGAAIAGSFLSEIPTGIHSLVNRGFIVLPTGNYHFYDKHHLFSLGGENRLLDAGTSQCPSVEFKGWLLRLAICYDLRFPVWNRRIANHASLDYDLLIVPANWPESRRYAWQHLLIARAIENQAYVAGVDRSGTDEYGDYPGDMTQIYDMWGKPIGQTTESGNITTAILSKAALTTARTRFSPWRDADTFTLS